ncbi:MAG: ATP-binding cassette protein [Actinomycetota bacterium]|nr:ATP-binding cassette protein [Actinomycetota bacterium]
MLELSGVDRFFGERQVLHDVSFAVRPGVLTGFIGANGAGKTTTMRIVLGVIGANAGKILWDGRPLDKNTRRTFGYMPEERGLYPKMKVLDQLVHLGRLFGLPPSEAADRALRLLTSLGLQDRVQDRLESLSLGNQQRVQVVAAILHDPSALILDEPFSGLDPVAVDVMAGMLRARAALGNPVLFSSHQLDLVERLCDDIVIIDEGRVVLAGDSEQLRRERAGSRFRLVVGGAADRPDPADDADDWLRSDPRWKVLELEGPRALVEILDPAHEQPLLAKALEQGPVHEFTPVVPTLADIYRQTVR